MARKAKRNSIDHITGNWNRVPDPAEADGRLVFNQAKLPYKVYWESMGNVKGFLYAEIDGKDGFSKRGRDYRIGRYVVKSDSNSDRGSFGYSIYDRSGSLFNPQNRDFGDIFFTNRFRSELAEYALSSALP